MSSQFITMSHPPHKAFMKIGFVCFVTHEQIIIQQLWKTFCLRSSVVYLFWLRLWTSIRQTKGMRACLLSSSTYFANTHLLDSFKCCRISHFISGITLHCIYTIANVCHSQINAFTHIKYSCITFAQHQTKTSDQSFVLCTSINWLSINQTTRIYIFFNWKNYVSTCSLAIQSILFIFAILFAVMDNMN